MSRVDNSTEICIRINNQEIKQSKIKNKTKVLVLGNNGKLPLILCEIFSQF